MADGKVKVNGVEEEETSLVEESSLESEDMRSRTDAEAAEGEEEFVPASRIKDLQSGYTKTINQLKAQVDAYERAKAQESEQRAREEAELRKKYWDDLKRTAPRDKQAEIRIAEAEERARLAEERAERREREERMREQKRQALELIAQETLTSVDDLLDAGDPDEAWIKGVRKMREELEQLKQTTVREQHANVNVGTGKTSRKKEPDDAQKALEAGNYQAYIKAQLLKAGFPD